MLLIPCLIILTLVILALTSPFWRKDPAPFAPFHDDDRNQELADLAVEREVLARSLQELDDELAQGRLDEEDYARLKATDERRLLAVLDRIEELGKQGGEASMPTDGGESASTQQSIWFPVTVCSILVLFTSFGIYTFVQWQAMQKLMAAQTQMAGGGPNPLEMVARLEARLKENPNDLEGQIMAGRSYQALERWEEAKKAWTKVLELDPGNHQAHYNLGVILIETRQFDDPEVFQQALNHFTTVWNDLPNQPGVNWYRGLALWYLNRHRETEEAWATAYKHLDPASPDAKFVKEALTKLRAGETPF